MSAKFICCAPGCMREVTPSVMYCAEHAVPNAADLPKGIAPLNVRDPAPIERALATQVGGSHYKNLAIQPAEFCHRNGIGKLEGDVIYYVARWRDKNGVEDLRKARHTLDILIELETAKPVTDRA